LLRTWWRAGFLHHVGVTAQGEADHAPVVTAEVRWKPGAHTSHEAIGAAWDAVAHAVAAADVRFSLKTVLHVPKAATTTSRCLLCSRSGCAAGQTLSSPATSAAARHEETCWLAGSVRPSRPQHVAGGGCDAAVRRRSGVRCGAASARAVRGDQPRPGAACRWHTRTAGNVVQVTRTCTVCSSGSVCS